MIAARCVSTVLTLIDSSSRDLLVAATFREHLEDLALARRHRGAVVGRCPLSSLMDEPVENRLRDLGGEIGMVLGKRFDGRLELRDRIRLQDVAPRAGGEDLVHVAFRTVHRVDEHLGQRALLANAARRFQTVELGHRQIEDGDVGAKSAGQAHRRMTGAGFATDLPIGVGLQEPVAVHAGPLRGRPPGGCGSSPVSSDRHLGDNDRPAATHGHAERAAELAEPLTHARDPDAERVGCGADGRGRPLGFPTAQAPAVHDLQGDLRTIARQLDRRRGASGVAVDVGEALLRDAEKGDLDVEREAPDLLLFDEVDGDPATADEAVDEPAERGGQSGLVQERWMQDVGERANLPRRLLDERRALGEQLLGQRVRYRLPPVNLFEIEPKRQEVLRRAVVEIASDPPAFVVLHPKQSAGELAEREFICPLG